MLRSRLYIGMFPVAGLLILVCLYSVYNYRKLSDRLESLHSVHYAAISDLERVLLATSQLERAILLEEDGKSTIAERAYARSAPALKDWLESDSARAEEGTENELPQLVRNLLSLGASVFESKGDADLEILEAVVERLEEAALRSISGHNSVIRESGTVFQNDSRTHYYVVVSAIVASVFLMGYVAYSLSQRILGPVDALAEMAGKLGDQNWDTSDYRPSAKDEIARLEQAFVDMAGRIQEYQRITNKQLARNRRRMEECFNNLPNPVLFLNAKRQIAYRNPSAIEVLDQVDWKDELLPQLSSRIDTVLGTGEEVVETDFDETFSVRIDNEPRHFLPIFVRVDSEEVDDIECGVVLQDITQLRLSDDLKSDLVATVSHEIKTPVTSATMALHLVLEKSLGDLTADQEEMLETANSDLNRLKRLLNHLLEIARIERKAPRLESVLVEPIRIVSQVIDAYSISAQNREIQLVAEVEEGLPSIRVDFKAIEVGLSNYLSNAVKYGPIGSRVEIYARKVGDRVRFGVVDEGPGIPEEDVDKVFEKFYRASKHRKMEGIGLGLSIVKDIALAHGGTAGCRLREGADGCDFYFEIDAAVVEEEVEIDE